MIGAPPEPAIVRVLGNPMNRALITALEQGPSYPRELANRLQATEGQVQKHLKRMAQAGLVEAQWHHDRKTVKLYTLRAQGAHVSFRGGAITERLDLPAIRLTETSQGDAPQPAQPPTAVIRDAPEETAEEPSADPSREILRAR